MEGKKCLYIDTMNSGISGDMFLATLLELTPNPENIINNLRSLSEFLSGTSKLDLDLEKVTRSSLLVNQLKIIIKESKHHRTVKKLKEGLQKFLTKISISNPAQVYANGVLDCLIEAEAQVHGDEIEKVHLHELSSVDTLIDIAGVTMALDGIGVFQNEIEIYCSEIPLGGGFVKTAHGKLPVPAPATSKIIENSNLIFKGGPIESELVTPTGAALLVNLSPTYLNFFPKMKINKISYGMGQKKFSEFSNILRIFYGELAKESNIIKEESPLINYIEKIIVLETDVDDVSGELIGNFINIMEKEEVLDILVIPALTKKNRTSHLIKILCKQEHQFKIMQKTIEELGTLGVRFYEIDRICIDREINTLEVEIEGAKYHVRCKISFMNTEKGKKIINIKPEYEDLKLISKESNISVRKLHSIVNKEISLNLSRD